MRRCLFLGSDSSDAWRKRVLEKKPDAIWLDKIPTVDELEPHELLLEAFFDVSLKREVLRTIA